MELSGAVRTGHFVLDSGLHSTRYFQAVDVLARTDVASALLDAVAGQWGDSGAATVVGANEAGCVMAWEIARRLGATPRFARRGKDDYRIVGGAPLPSGPVLIVDDITTTGGTALQLIDAVKAVGGTPLGVALLATKGLFTIDLGVPTTVLVTLEGMDAVEPEKCVACLAGEPVTT